MPMLFAKLITNSSPTENIAAICRSEYVNKTEYVATKYSDEVTAKARTLGRRGGIKRRNTIRSSFTFALTTKLLGPLLHSYVEDSDTHPNPPKVTETSENVS